MNISLTTYKKKQDIFAFKMFFYHICQDILLYERNER